jgi:hypothetical protein
LASRFDSGFYHVGILADFQVEKVIVQSSNRPTVQFSFTFPLYQKILTFVEVFRRRFAGTAFIARQLDFCFSVASKAEYVSTLMNF